jgi:hypothetical protein
MAARVCGKVAFHCIVICQSSCVAPKASSTKKLLLMGIELQVECVPFIERTERKGRGDCRFSARRLLEQEDEAMIDRVLARNASVMRTCSCRRRVN